MSKNISKSIVLFDKIADIIVSARQNVIAVVNLTMVHTYYEIGRMIVEDEQQGKERAPTVSTFLKTFPND